MAAKDRSPGETIHEEVKNETREENSQLPKGTTVDQSEDVIDKGVASFMSEEDMRGRREEQ